MIRVLAICLACFTTAALAQDAGATDAAMTDEAAAEATPVERWLADPSVVFEAAEVDLEDFLWIARPVVVFADTPADPAYREQLDLLLERPEALAERDVVVIVDTDREARSDIRTRLRPRGFMLTLIGKDGEVEIRKPRPWDVRELSRSIDKMPLRQQEIRDRR